MTCVFGKVSYTVAAVLPAEFLFPSKTLTGFLTEC